jgi:hypothetical protein
MGKITASILFLLFLTSCVYVKTTKDGFRKTAYCYDGKNTGLEKRIKLNGYYEYTHEYTGKRFYSPSGKITEKLKSEIKKSTERVKYSFYENGIAKLNLRRINNSFDGTDARYILNGDTIKILHTSAPEGQTHPLIYDYFRIINDSTLKYLGFSYDKELDADRMRKFKEGDANELDNLGKYSYAHFVQFDSLPDSENIWLKKKKWFWCNETQYKSWKKNAYNKD